MPGFLFGPDLPSADRRRSRSMLAHPSAVSRALQPSSASEGMAPSAGESPGVGPSKEIDDRLEEHVRLGVQRRARNEWIEEATVRFGEANALDVFVCECSDPGCARTIELSRDDYEWVRREPRCFAIAKDHTDPEVDRVVAENDRMAVVEKWFGQAERIAVETDPRRGFPSPDQWA